MEYNWELSTRHTSINRQLEYFQACLAVYNAAHRAGANKDEMVKIGAGFPAVNLWQLYTSMIHRFKIRYRNHARCRTCNSLVPNTNSLPDVVENGLTVGAHSEDPTTRVSINQLLQRQFQSKPVAWKAHNTGCRVQPLKAHRAIVGRAAIQSCGQCTSMFALR